jgi:hypothetical protein
MAKMRWSKFASTEDSSPSKNHKGSDHYVPVGYIDQAWLVSGNASSYDDEILEKASRILRATRSDEGIRAANVLDQELRSRDDARKAARAKLDMRPAR